MFKIYLFFLTFFVLAGCSDSSSTEHKEIASEQPATTSGQKDKALNKVLADTSKVKNWLINVIESYPNSNDPNAAFKNLRSALTDDYYNYKQDAINLIYDNGDTTFTEEAFKKKWQSKFNTELVGEGGFIISTQDNGQIKVKTCNLVKHIGSNASLYKVVIEDLDYKLKFKRDFKVIEQNGKLFIDDILEYE